MSCCRSSQCPNKEFLLRVSYMEIYNETVTDLLCDSWKRKPLEIREGNYVSVIFFKKIIYYSFLNVQHLMVNVYHSGRKTSTWLIWRKSWWGIRNKRWPGSGKEKVKWFICFINLSKESNRTAHAALAQKSTVGWCDTAWCEAELL